MIRFAVDFDDRFRPCTFMTMEGWRGLWAHERVVGEAGYPHESWPAFREVLGPEQITGKRRIKRRAIELARKYDPGALRPPPRNWIPPLPNY